MNSSSASPTVSGETPGSISASRPPGRALENTCSPGPDAGAQVIFHHLYAELKGCRGIPGQCQIQNLKAMRAGLGIIVNLHGLSERADPENCLLLSPPMRHVYGLQTSASVFKLFIMILSHQDRQQAFVCQLHYLLPLPNLRYGLPLPRSLS